MKKDKLLRMLKAKEERKKDLQARGQKTEDIGELRGINIELESLNTDISELRSMIDEIEKEERTAEQSKGKEDDELEKREQENIEEKRNAKPEGSFNPLGIYTNTQIDEKRSKAQKEIQGKYEERGEKLKSRQAVKFSIDEMPELRAVSLGSSHLVAETKYSRNVNETFNEVSGLIDMVNAVPLVGGESYTKAFEKSSSEGDYTLEDGEYEDADPNFDYVSIGKAKITAYTELTDEAKKLPNIDYQSMVRKSVAKSLRKKVTKQILLGAGGSNALTGIFNAPEKVIPVASDIEISEIDADTLDTIVFGYGGDEDVEGNAYLILNKQDLAKFAAIRATDGKKLYKIELKGNTGTISSDDSFKVPFIINSGCPALSATGTAADTYCMAYGKLEGYEMPIFSDIEVEESIDYKFKSGQIAYRGAVWCGGNVAMYKGFVRVKKIIA